MIIFLYFLKNYRVIYAINVKYIST